MAWKVAVMSGESINTTWVEKKMTDSGRTPGEIDISISTTDDEWTDGQKKKGRKRV